MFYLCAYLVGCFQGQGKKQQHPGASYNSPLGKHSNSGMLCIILNAYRKVFSYELHVLICGSTGNCSQESQNLHYFFSVGFERHTKNPFKAFPIKVQPTGKGREKSSAHLTDILGDVNFWHWMQQLVKLSHNHKGPQNFSRRKKQVQL